MSTRGDAVGKHEYGKEANADADVDVDVDVDISDHSHSMRKACNYCIALFQRLEAANANASDPNANNLVLKSLLEDRYNEVYDQIQRSSNEHRFRRTEAYRAFWSSSSLSSFTTHDNSVAKNNYTTRPETITSDAERPDSIQIETMQVRLNTDERNINKDTVAQEIICPEQVYFFKYHFQDLNVPCLIKGLDRSSHFEFLNRNWRAESITRSTSSDDCDDNVDGNTSDCNSFTQNKQQPKTNTNFCPKKKIVSKVNRQWFRDELGDNFLVPLRYSPHNNENDTDDHCDSEPLLDGDGRAVECETWEVSIKEWIDLLEVSQQERQADSNESKQHTLIRDNEKEPNTIIYYLKDWHLQQRFPSSLSTPPDHNCSDRFCDCSLYSCPEFFGHDLLNSFLIKFTKGDYRFCYWGPFRSFTARHSDVLHSFSWSYNVVGTKEWTFYHDQHSDDDSTTMNTERKDKLDSNDDDRFGKNRTKTFTIVQETGETMFVPATWQHRVSNLEETISINHNWITSSNLDLVWDCLSVEMTAIQKELQGWDGGVDQNMEACENMLRGCIGLDVTSFVLMTLVRILEALIALVVDDDNSGAILANQQKQRLLFDTFRLTSVLQVALATKDTLLQPRNRFRAVLQSDDLTQNLESMVKRVIDLGKLFKN